MDFSLYIWELDDTSKFTEDKLLLWQKKNQGILDLVCLVTVWLGLGPASGQSPPGPLELFTLLISESSFLLAAACAQPNKSCMKFWGMFFCLSQWNMPTYYKIYSLSFWGRTTKGVL